MINENSSGNTQPTRISPEIRLKADIIRNILALGDANPQIQTNVLIYTTIMHIYHTIKPEHRPSVAEGVAAALVNNFTQENEKKRGAVCTFEPGQIYLIVEALNALSSARPELRPKEIANLKATMQLYNQLYDGTQNG
jgi:hypothetical protein